MFKRASKVRTVLVVALGTAFLSARVTLAAGDGKAVYEQHCAPCHGVSGKGDGPAARALKPPPGSFATSPKVHDDLEVARVITSGTPHPTFAGKLSADQIQAVAKYVKSMIGQ